MPLDPQIKLMLDQVAAAGIPKLTFGTAEESRRKFDALTQAFKSAQEVGRIENRSIPGPAGEIPVRIYTPRSDGPFGVLVYFHGGGWVLGGLESEDGFCRALCNGAGCVVASVDYRLAPEHKFPAAADDAYAATQWVAENAGQIGADPGRVAVGGDSAGGNLAAVVAQMARDRGGPRVIYQLLMYPVIDAAMSTSSYRTNAEGYFLTRSDMAWFWRQYLASQADKSNPYASPLRAKSLSGLPPALVITAEFDPLRDEGETYAVRMRQAGVTASCSRYDGAVHGFLGLSEIAEIGKRGLAEVCAGLRRAFSNPASTVG